MSFHSEKITKQCSKRPTTLCRSNSFTLSSLEKIEPHINVINNIEQNDPEISTFHSKSKSKSSTFNSNIFSNLKNNPENQGAQTNFPNTTRPLLQKFSLKSINQKASFCKSSNFSPLVKGPKPTRPVQSQASPTQIFHRQQSQEKVLSVYENWQSSSPFIAMNLDSCSNLNNCNLGKKSKNIILKSRLINHSHENSPLPGSDLSLNASKVSLLATPTSQNELQLQNNVCKPYSTRNHFIPIDDQNSSESSETLSSTSSFSQANINKEFGWVKDETTCGTISDSSFNSSLTSLSSFKNELATPIPFQTKNAALQVSHISPMVTKRLQHCNNVSDYVNETLSPEIGTISLSRRKPDIAKSSLSHLPFNKNCHFGIKKNYNTPNLGQNYQNFNLVEDTMKNALKEKLNKLSADRPLTELSVSDQADTPAQILQRPRPLLFTKTQNQKSSFLPERPSNLNNFRNGKTAEDNFSDETLSGSSNTSDLSVIEANSRSHIFTFENQIKSQTEKDMENGLFENSKIKNNHHKNIFQHFHNVQATAPIKIFPKVLAQQTCVNPIKSSPLDENSNLEICRLIESNIQRSQNCTNQEPQKHGRRSQSAQVVPLVGSMARPTSTGITKPNASTAITDTFGLLGNKNRDSRTNNFGLQLSNHDTNKRGDGRDLTLPTLVRRSSDYSRTSGNFQGDGRVDGEALLSIHKSSSNRKHSNVIYKNPFKIIDCRYPYEFKAGHIKFSENIWLAEDMIKYLFQEDEEKEATANATADDQNNNLLGTNLDRNLDPLILLFCEFSQNRSVKLACEIRNYDRKTTPIKEYPRLKYPEIYILDGGFQKFYESFKNTPNLFGPENGHFYKKMYGDSDDKKSRDQMNICNKKFDDSLKMVKSLKILNFWASNEPLASSNLLLSQLSTRSDNIKLSIGTETKLINVKKTTSVRPTKITIDKTKKLKNSVLLKKTPDEEMNGNIIQTRLKTKIENDIKTGISASAYHKAGKRAKRKRTLSEKIEEIENEGGERKIGKVNEQKIEENFSFFKPKESKIPVWSNKEQIFNYTNNYNRSHHNIFYKDSYCEQSASTEYINGYHVSVLESTSKRTKLENGSIKSNKSQQIHMYSGKSEDSNTRPRFTTLTNASTCSREENSAADNSETPVKQLDRYKLQKKVSSFVRMRPESSRKKFKKKLEF